MKIDKNRAQNVFDNYVKNYNADDEKVKLKIEHTYRVSGLCVEIAEKSGFSKDEAEIAWLMGLLHDIGRFEQLRLYNTFSDAQSIDHAEFGADILFKENKIRDFTDDNSEDELIEKAVRYHSAYRVPQDFSERERRFANLLRDADKVDILKVNFIVPTEEIYNVTTKELRNCTVTKEVMEAFYEEHAVLRSLKKTPVDHLAGHISLVYELVYPVSYKIVQQQGFLDKLMDFKSELDETNMQFEQIRSKMGEYIKKKIL